jgi:hypothetical protein
MRLSFWYWSSYGLAVPVRRDGSLTLATASRRHPPQFRRMNGPFTSRPVPVLVSSNARSRAPCPKCRWRSCRQIRGAPSVALQYGICELSNQEQCCPTEGRYDIVR